MARAPLHLRDGKSENNLEIRFEGPKCGAGREKQALWKNYRRARRGA